MGKAKMEACDAKPRGRAQGLAAQDQGGRVFVTVAYNNVSPAQRYLGKAQRLGSCLLGGQTSREMQVGTFLAQAIRDFAVVEPAEEEALATPLNEVAYAFRLDDVHAGSDYHDSLHSGDLRPPQERRVEKRLQGVAA